MTDQLLPAELAGTDFELLCDIEDLTVGLPARAEVGGVVMAIVRTGLAEVEAINDRCSHADVSLAEGDVEGRTLECFLHGSRFDLRTGRPSGPPATRPVDVYPVRLIDGDVYVSPSPIEDPIAFRNESEL